MLNPSVASVIFCLVSVNYIQREGMSSLQRILTADANYVGEHYK